MRIMDHHKPPRGEAKTRCDGWTLERRERFLDGLAAGCDVRRACAGVGLSHTAAYNLRRRDPAFAREWRAAQRTARLCAEDAFMAMLPEGIRDTMAELSGERQLRGVGAMSQDSVRVVARV
jgi:hypothetical protein